MSGCNHSQNSISLLTDFGNDESTYLVESSIRHVNQNVHVKVISHHVYPFNILSGAWKLCRVVSSPTEHENSIYVCVIDPDVGSDRECIIVKTKTGKYLVGPNNGVLSLAFLNEGIDIAVKIENEYLTLLKYAKSNTFHGKDIFGPVAGYLASGIDIQKFGTILPEEKLHKIKLDLVKTEDLVEGYLVDIDSFGAIRTNIPNEFLSKINNHKVRLTISQLFKILYDGEAKISKTFSGNDGNEVLLVPSSTGCVDIVINKKNARKYIGISHASLDLSELKPITKITIEK